MAGKKQTQGGRDHLTQPVGLEWKRQQERKKSKNRRINHNEIIIMLIMVAASSNSNSIMQQYYGRPASCHWFKSWIKLRWQRDQMKQRSISKS